MFDFNHRNPSNSINALIDAALVKSNKREPSRDYLGGSVLGYECERQNQFRFFGTPRDRDFTGKQLKIFAVGHALEDLAAKWLRLAGFDLETVHRTGSNLGEQIGFSVLGGKIRGHRDGKFLSGPEVIRFPCLWECKSMAAKYWKACKEKGVMVSNPEYFGQTQIYMAYFDLTENPAIFTAINKDSQELLHEPVDFAPAVAQNLSDHGLKIIQACESGIMLPRISDDPAWYKCKWCDWHERCHSMKG